MLAILSCLVDLILGNLYHNRLATKRSLVISGQKMPKPAFLSGPLHWANEACIVYLQEFESSHP